MLFAALSKVFSNPAYVLLALIASASVFAFATWLPNLSLIAEVMGHPELPLAQKLELPISLLGSIATNFSVLSASYTVLIAILFGMNLAMIVYLLRNRTAALKKGAATTGFLGAVSGLLGVGCAACGSLILTSILSLVGASGALALLPFGGGEFGILGVLLLLWSLHTIAKQIRNPFICLPNFSQSIV